MTPKKERSSFTRSVVTAATHGRTKQRPAPALTARPDVKAKANPTDRAYQGWARSALTQPPPLIVGVARNPSNTRRFDGTRPTRADPASPVQPLPPQAAPGPEPSHGRRRGLGQPENHYDQEQNSRARYARKLADQQPRMGPVQHRPPAPQGDRADLPARLLIGNHPEARERRGHKQKKAQQRQQVGYLAPGHPRHHARRRDAGQRPASRDPWTTRQPPANRGQPTPPTRPSGTIRKHPAWPDRQGTCPLLPPT